MGDKTPPLAPPSPPPCSEGTAPVHLAESDGRLALSGMWEFETRVARWPNHITGAILCAKLSLSIGAAAAGPGFTRRLCFDWDWIATAPERRGQDAV